MLTSNSKFFIGHLIWISVVVSSKLASDVNASEINFRLPNNTQPESYDLTIRTRVDDGVFSFNGTVRIDIMVIEATTSIVLHQFNLAIERIHLESEDNATFIEQYSYNATLQFLSISLSKPLTIENRYTIQIEYNGTLRDDYLGFYRTSYLTENGTRIWLATTQFQAAEARHAFPCYDEPGIKVPFTIRIIHGKAYSALSNMPVNRVIDNLDGTATTEFESTPPISTYIVAFMVSDFVYISDPESIIPQRAFARSNIIDNSKFILDIGNRMLDSLVEYFGVNYSLPKLDQAGIPNFRYGAMENWGLVKYREDYFNYDENVSVYTTKFSIVRIVGHELVHQWFGNLVSPSWWQYLWLNEGFARYFEYKGIQLTHPEWELGDNYFVPRILQTVFQSDATETSPPMNLYINHTDSINSQFSLMTSDKAACVIRMFLNVVTEATFLKGLKRYLNDRSYSAATEEDLFHFIETVAHDDNAIPEHLNLTAAMSSWTSQAGFPLLSVVRNYSEVGQQLVFFSQERYLPTSSNFAYNASWWIPINFAHDRTIGLDETQASHWLPPHTNLTLNISELEANDWLMVNMQGSGYYRVLYDEPNYKLLSDAMVVNVSQFNELNRGQLIDDTYNFVQVGKLAYDTLLNAIKFLAYVSDYTAWYPAITAFNTIELRFSGSENFSLLTRYLRNLIEKFYASVGIRDIYDEPLIRKYCRTIAIQWACKLGVTHCLDDALKDLRSVIETGTDFHQNVRDVLYCAALRNGTTGDFHSVWNRMQRSNVSSTRNLLINSLGCSSSTPLALLEFVNSSLPSTNYNNVSYTFAERINVFNSVYQGGLIGLEIAVQFLMENNFEAYNTYGGDNLQNIFIGMASRIGGDRLMVQFQILLENAKARNLILDHIFDEANRRLNENQRWLSTHGEIISRWLLEQNFVN